jgi:hypothetical protein
MSVMPWKCTAITSGGLPGCPWTGWAHKIGAPCEHCKYSIFVKRTERGWGGHFIGGHECLFRRNTLLEYKDIKIVVSTVGVYRPGPKKDVEMIGSDRYYETMAFHSEPSDTEYHDADVKRQVYFDSPWTISERGKDNEADKMHENVVKEISKRMVNGEEFKLVNGSKRKPEKKIDRSPIDVEIKEV